MSQKQNPLLQGIGGVIVLVVIVVGAMGRSDRKKHTDLYNKYVNGVSAADVRMQTLLEQAVKTPPQEAGLKAAEWLEQAEGIHRDTLSKTPQNEEILVIHNKVVERSEHWVAAFRHLKALVQTGDEAKRKAFEDELKQVDATFKEIQKLEAEYAKRHGLTMESERKRKR